nr:putative ribonuclease H-like domain-containing protein [Tanacetum cinerariifolium]
MNEICLQKGIKREFSNARTPQQNGVAERRNRTLIKAARTMLANAKLPVTFWAEVVNTACYVQNMVLVNRVFNKRTKRVEENLHVEFLENKAIEKGIGPNWLFDIDSLTKSMNYVPMDAGTISTNLLGTKDATSQEVKKDVSSLRYIALPNWAHDALLEFSSNESNREEVDISNMETVITASPSATLRIHNDHPKSQIIGPVDTPI